MKQLIYGDIILYETICPGCGEQILSGDEEISCDLCGTKYKITHIEQTEIIVSSTGRKSIPVNIRKKLLVEQDNHCFWCGRLFGITYERKHKIYTLKPCGDHKIPFSWIQRNPDNNWVLACNLCNAYKHNKMYDDEKQMKDYLLQKWDADLSSGNINFF